MPSSEVAAISEVEADLLVVKRGCEELLVESEFISKLVRSRATGQPLLI